MSFTNKLRKTSINITYCNYYKLKNKVSFLHRRETFYTNPNCGEHK